MNDVIQEKTKKKQIVKGAKILMISMFIGVSMIFSYKYYSYLNRPSIEEIDEMFHCHIVETGLHQGEDTYRVFSDDIYGFSGAFMETGWEGNLFISKSDNIHVLPKNNNKLKFEEEILMDDLRVEVKMYSWSGSPSNSIEVYEPYVILSFNHNDGYYGIQLWTDSNYKYDNSEDKLRTKDKQQIEGIIKTIFGNE